MFLREDEPLTLTKIFLFWVPLAIMWIIMGVELPAVNAIIARLPFPKENLAAFGVTFSLSLLMEGPIIQMLTAGTALAHNLENYKRLLAFMHVLAAGLTSLHLIVGLTPLYDIIARQVIGIPEHLVGLSRQAFLFMVPWSASVGYRRMWQGVLIRYGNTRVIPITMIIRLLVMGAVLAVGYVFKFLPAASIGGLALTAGVVMGAVSAYAFLRPMLERGDIAPAKPGEEVLSWKQLLIFYLPLALTSFIVLAIRPIITAGLARASHPLDSLAAWPVIHSFLFLFSSIALSYQEVVVALLRKDEDYRHLYRFTWIVAFALLGLFYLVQVLSLDVVWFEYIVSLPADLMEFVRVPILILPFMPFFLTQVTWFRGLQVKRRETLNITKGVTINAVVLSVVLFIGAAFFPFAGVITAALALVLANCADSIYLRIKTVVQQRSSMR
jgi:hypothetical protein